MWKQNEFKGTLVIEPTSEITDEVRSITIDFSDITIHANFGLQRGKKVVVSVDIYHDTTVYQRTEVDDDDMVFLEYISNEDIFEEESEKPPYDFDKDSSETGGIL